MDFSTNIKTDIEKFAIFSGFEIYQMIKNRNDNLLSIFRSNIRESPSINNEISLNI